MRRALFLPILLLAAGCSEEPQRGFAATSEGARQEPFVAIPPGNVPRGASRLEAMLAPPGPPVTPALLRLGARVYRDTCAPCHGRRGQGDGPVVERGFPRPAPLSAGAHSPAETVAAVTAGTGAMPSLAAQVDPVERWAVAHYVAGEGGNGD